MQCSRLSDSWPSLLQLLGDLFTGVATHRLVNLSKLSNDAPLYLYHFLEDGDYNWGKVSFNISAKGKHPVGETELQQPKHI